jgi:raffinose/stachyose/melibiose transport system substrate-binding protein
MSPALRRAAASLVGALVVTTGAACGDGNGGQPAPPSAVTVTWAVADDSPLRELWQGVAGDFVRLHPNVTVELRGSGPADLFEQQGGVELAKQVDAGFLMDITDATSTELDSIGGAAAMWQVGSRTYGLPYRARVEGFWYSKPLFAQAGIDQVPSTIAELHEAVRELREAGVIPIALDGNATWPAVHYWQQFALRACPRDVLRQPMLDHPCFVQAGEGLTALLATNPFDEDIFDPDYEISAASLLATDRAGLLLSSSWALAEMAQFQPTGDRFGWFPFPTTGGAGDPGDQLGSGEGFSCAATAAVECIDLLKYIVSSEVQERLAGAGELLPVAPGVRAAEPAMAPMVTALHDAAHVQLWLDWIWEPDVVEANFDAVMNQFHGTGTAADVVAAMLAA